MTEKKSFTGWMERPTWERALLVVLILGILIAILAIYSSRTG